MLSFLIPFFHTPEAGLIVLETSPEVPLTPGLCSQFSPVSVHAKGSAFHSGAQHLRQIIPMPDSSVPSLLVPDFLSFINKFWERRFQVRLQKEVSFTNSNVHLSTGSTYQTVKYLQKSTLFLLKKKHTRSNLGSKRGTFLHSSEIFTILFGNPIYSSF